MLSFESASIYNSRNFPAMGTGMSWHCMLECFAGIECFGVQLTQFCVSDHCVGLPPESTGAGTGLSYA